MGSKVTRPPVTDTETLHKFIMYDAYASQPIFEAYKKFCKAIGNPNFDYIEYDYWYYKFYNVDSSKEDDRKPDHKPKMLEDLPNEILDKIFKKLEPIDVTKLRLMNKTFNKIADRQPKQYKLVEIKMTGTRFTWNLDGAKFYVPQEPSDEPYRHTKATLGELLEKLRQPNLEIEHLSIHGPLFRNSERLSSRLEPSSLHVKSVFIADDSAGHVFDMFVCLVPGHLEQIRLNARHNASQYLELFTDTEQWRQARDVTILELGLYEAQDLVQFVHLESFELNLLTISGQELIELRDLLANATNFKTCRVHCTNVYESNWNKNLGAHLGEVVRDRSRLIHRYPIPESNDLLEFKIGDKMVEITKVQG